MSVQIVSLKRLGLAFQTQTMWYLTMKIGFRSKERLEYMNILVLGTIFQICILKYLHLILEHLKIINLYL